MAICVIEGGCIVRFGERVRPRRDAVPGCREADRSSGVENMPRSCVLVSMCRVRNMVERDKVVGVKKAHTDRPTPRPCFLKLFVRRIAAKILVARVPRPVADETSSCCLLLELRPGSTASETCPAGVRPRAAAPLDGARGDGEDEDVADAGAVGTDPIEREWRWMIEILAKAGRGGTTRSRVVDVEGSSPASVGRSAGESL